MQVFWLWKIYMGVLAGLCILGFTRISPETESGFLGGCKPWDEEPWESRILLRGLLSRTDYSSFQRVVMADQDFAYRLQYTWGNATLFVPDHEGQEWKDLGYAEEVLKFHCIPIPENCPGVSQFLRHHYVGKLLQQGRKVKTLAGDKIWYNQVNGNIYLYPGGVKVLRKDIAWNGEVWIIEKPLWSGPITSKDTQKSS